MICKKLIINKLLKTLNNLISSPSHTPSFHKCKKSIKISIDNLNRIIQSRNDDNFNQSSNRSSSHQKSRHNSSRFSSKGIHFSINWSCIGSKCEKYKSKFTVAVPYYNRTPSFTRRTKSSIVNFSVYKSLQWEPPSNLNCHDKQEQIHKVKPDIVQSMLKMLQSRNSKLSNVWLTIYSSATKRHRQQAVWSAQL